ncbi:MAG: hypothetical protein HYX32_07285 [Actinobacteria bacterium]|nr:hypothetical protein [Actinomycetota bacterium]
MSDDDMPANGPDPASADEPTQAHDPISAPSDSEPDSEELALSALAAGFGGEPPVARSDEPDLDGDAATVRSLLADGVPAGKSIDTELALARVISSSRKRTGRDRVTIAAVAAAALLLVVFVAAWDRSGPSSDLETAGRRAPGSTPAPGSSLGVLYSGDPGDGSVPQPGTTGGEAAPDVPNVTTPPARSTTSTGNAGANPSVPASNDPVLQVNISADSASVNVGDRAWFTVQVNNSGGDGWYEGNDCGKGRIKVTLTPIVPSGGSPAEWSGEASTLAAAAAQGGGSMTIGAVAGGTSIGELSVRRTCPAISLPKKFGAGETISERVAVDLAPAPGSTLAGTYAATAEFRANGSDSGAAPFNVVTATDRTTFSVTGDAPALPDASALQSVATNAAVAGWVGAQPKPIGLQSRYYRGAWEILLSPVQASQSSEILRIRLTSTGAVTDVRAVRNVSATSDDPGATAPVVGERKLFP